METQSFEWISGNLALDFVNTANWPAEGLSNDRLRDYQCLVAWARKAGFPVAAATPGSAEAARIAELTHRIRGILHEIFADAAGGRAPEERPLAQFNAALSAALDRLEVASAGGGGFAWALISPDEELERPLWPVLWAAARLLTGGEAGKIRRCAGPQCGRLFLDHSRRGNRRWCSMEECGNRAKARRHYAKLRKRRSGLR
jgi:predicted RNA-binding Zn ribbon-like protein